MVNPKGHGSADALSVRVVLPQESYKAGRIFSNACESGRSITSLSFDESGESLVTASNDDAFKLWSCRSGKYAPGLEMLSRLSAHADSGWLTVSQDTDRLSTPKSTALTTSGSPTLSPTSCTPPPVSTVRIFLFLFSLMPAPYI